MANINGANTATRRPHLEKSAWVCFSICSDKRQCWFIFVLMSGVRIKTTYGISVIFSFIVREPKNFMVLFDREVYMIWYVMTHNTYGWSFISMCWLLADKTKMNQSLPKEIKLKISSEKWRPFCRCLNLLNTNIPVCQNSTNKNPTDGPCHEDGFGSCNHPLPITY